MMASEEVNVIARPVGDEAKEWQAGELYLFTASQVGEPERTLWAVVAAEECDGIVVESATEDFSHFSRWVRLSPVWQCRRLATREELRDYAYALALYEVQHRA